MRLLLALLASLTLSGSADARCFTRGYFHLTSEGPWSYSMQAEAGKRCRRSFRSGGTMIFKRLNLIEHPRSGRVELQEGGHYAYTPNLGFRGRDQFMLQVCGEQQGRPGCANLKYAVTVD